MTLPLLLCALMVAASGMHFGLRFAATHAAGRLPLVPALAHGAVSVSATLLAALLDLNSGAGLWTVVAGASLAGLVAGTLLWRPAQAPAHGTPELTPGT